MHDKRNRTSAAGILAALFLCGAMPVMAQAASAPPALAAPASTSAAASTGGPTEQPETLSPAETSGAPDTRAILLATSPAPPTTETAPEAESVSTWDELARWMKEHEAIGGTVRLSAPIVCDSIYNAAFFSPTTLDLGEYSLTVTGELEFYSPYLTIKGNGGENASLRVAPGGYLGVTAHIVEPGLNGPTLWQDEGGILLADLSADNPAVHYAAQPLAYIGDSLVVPVAPGADAYALLPETVNADIFFEGTRQCGLQMAVAWNTEDEATKEAVLERRRTCVSGRFVEALAYRSLNCTLAFVNQPVTFLEVQAKKSNQILQILAEFTHPPRVTALEAEYSLDGGHWLPLDVSIEQSEATAQFTALLCDSSVPTDDLPLWDTAQHPLLYLRVHWPAASSAAEAYSDVIVIDGDTMQATSDIGGNRGGGTGLGSPPPLPPTGGETGGGGTTALPDTPPPASMPAEAPASPSSAATASATHRTEPAASQAPITSSKTGEATPVQSPESAAFLQPEVQTVVDADNAPTAGNSVSNPARTAIHTTVGIFATGAIIVLTMTWRRWGRKLRRSLRALRTGP